MRVVANLLGDPSMTALAEERAVARRKESAGIVLFWVDPHGELELLLVHPGGPFWVRKDEGAWSIAKGEVDDERQSRDLLGVARREFFEETGFKPEGDFVDLGSLKQRSGKRVHAWAVEGDWDPLTLRSNAVELEWPAKSGKIHRFPEVDRAAWFTVPTARKKILKGQEEFIDRLLSRLALSGRVTVAR